MHVYTVCMVLGVAGITEDLVDVENPAELRGFGEVFPAIFVGPLGIAVVRSARFSVFPLRRASQWLDPCAHGFVHHPKPLP